jgi:GNAT superfamily N-acetyltransferase
MDIIAIDDPTDAQILEWHAVVVAAQAGDHADLPTLSQTSARMLGLGPRKWAALDGVMAGVVWLRPPVEPGRAGEIDIHVRPEYRRGGVGTALLAVAADELRAGGSGTVIAQVLAGTPAVPFLEAHGFRCVLTLRELLLRVADVDPDRLRALVEAGPPRYRLVRWTGTVPAELAGAFAAAKVAMSGPAAADQLRWDADRVREMAEMVAKRGDDLYTVAALHGDAVAGFTEVVVESANPARAAQYDTAVSPEHRGRRLGIWVKAAMLEWLRAERPEVTEIETDNADDNRHMLAVNAELGFGEQREYREYQAEVADLPV